MKLCERSPLQGFWFHDSSFRQTYPRNGPRRPSLSSVFVCVAVAHTREPSVVFNITFFLQVITVSETNCKAVLIELQHKNCGVYVAWDDFPHYDS